MLNPIPIPIPMLILAMLLLPFVAALAVRPVALLSRAFAALLGPLSLLLCALIGLALALDLGSFSAAPAAPVRIGLGAAGVPVELLLKLDPLALVLALVSIALVLLSWTRGEDHPEPHRLRSALLVLAGGLLGLALAANALTSWLFLEVSTLAAGALLLTEGGPRSLTAMPPFVRWNAVGTGLAVVGLGLELTAASLYPESPNADTLGRLGFGILVLGFGVKVGFFPLTAWMMPVGQAAGARVSALLTGVLPALALVNLARLLTSGGTVVHGADALMVLGMVSAFAGAVGSWRAQAFPIFLMQLSLASLGALAMGFSLPGPAGHFSALALLLHFLLIHSALFVLAHRWRGCMTDLTGIAWRLPLTAGVTMLLAASLVGVPPLPGFWAKLMLVLSLADNGGNAVMVVLLVLLLATAVEAAAWLRLMRLLYRRTEDGTVEASAVNAAAGNLPRADRLPCLRYPSRVARAYFLLVAVLLLLATLFIAPLTEGLNLLVVPTASVAGPRLASEVDAAWRREIER